MQYQQAKDSNGNLRTDVIVLTTDDGVVLWIPNDPANRDWVAYQAWVAQGNTPLAPS